jgi:RimJ/RimL family protein N-acetyltransferase
MGPIVAQLALLKKSTFVHTFSMRAITTPRDERDRVPIDVNDLGQPLGRPIAEWEPPPHPPRDVMPGRFCRVEPLTERCAKELYVADQDDTGAATWTYLPYGPFISFEAYREWLVRFCRGDDPSFYAIVNLRNGEARGVAAYMRIDPPAGAIEVGHVHFSPCLQRTPVATEAMYLMMQRAFTLGYRRYEWKCDALNAPSRRAAQRLGFSFEGVFRQASVVKGRNRDTAWYSVVDREWPALREAFAQWCDPENFDEAGRQRRALSEMTRPLLSAIG